MRDGFVKPYATGTLTFGSFGSPLRQTRSAFAAKSATLARSEILRYAQQSIHRDAGTSGPARGGSFAPKDSNGLLALAETELPRNELVTVLSGELDRPRHPSLAISFRAYASTTALVRELYRRLVR